MEIIMKAHTKAGYRRSEYRFKYYYGKSKESGVKHK